MVPLLETVDWTGAGCQLETGLVLAVALVARLATMAPPAEPPIFEFGLLLHDLHRALGSSSGYISLSARGGKLFGQHEREI
jgi:hypothetical protein